MTIWNELKNAFDGISAANKELVDGIKEVTAETKRDIFSDWKREVPAVGDTLEKVDRTITTLKNVMEQMPESTLDPLNPNIQLQKILKEVKKAKKITSNDSIKQAQHLKVDRIGYSHHALSINENEVIHYQDGEVKIESTESFARGAKIYIVDTPRLYKKEEVLARAYSKLGEREYNLIFNNCEHFVRWALNGD